MGTTRHRAVPVVVVRTDGSVGWRMGEPSATPGLFIVAECPACHDVRRPDSRARSADNHVHRRWRLQTESGYLLGNRGVASLRDAEDAAATLGGLPIDWSDPSVATRPDPAIRNAALAILSRCGLARAPGRDRIDWL